MPHPPQWRASESRSTQAPAQSVRLTPHPESITGTSRRGCTSSPGTSRGTSGLGPLSNAMTSRAATSSSISGVVRPHPPLAASNAATPAAQTNR